MTKKETELQDRLLDVLEANTKAIGELFVLLTSMSVAFSKGCSKPQRGPDEMPLVESNPEPDAETKALEEEAEEMSEKHEKEAEAPKIDIEYCRKAMKAIQTVISKEEAKDFLATFGGATTIPKLAKKHYADFIEQATAIMVGGE